MVFWAAYARVYDQLWDNELMAAVGTCVARNLPAGSAVLDVGAGTGIVAAQLQAHGHTVTACEPTQAMAARCARKLPGLAVAPTRCEDLAAGVADNVVAVNLVHMLEDPVSGVAQLRRVCRPGGVVVLVTPDPDNGLLAVAAAQRRAGVNRWRAARFVAWHLILGPLAALCGLPAPRQLDWVRPDSAWLAQATDRIGPIGGVYWLFTLPAAGGTGQGVEAGGS
ncbi:class I SAM-dependent methyltransferase [Dactylosporangium sp. NPDC049742]|uniref:class I SAM-dependent methyltransferase n=1 Tax=Dactylosporangium sp. NPDC049742 TaxID=3154737 RepID=UPI00343474CE